MIVSKRKNERAYFKQLETSAVGAALIVGALILVWFEKATLSELVPFWVGAFALFFAKD